MAVLLIQDPNGVSEFRALSKTVPVSLGRHSSNDIRVDEPGIQILHARISWSGRHFEVVAATESGIDVNGQLVAASPLRAGDSIQIGTLTIFFYASRKEAEAALYGEAIESQDALPTVPDSNISQRTASRGAPTDEGPLGKKSIQKVTAAPQKGTEPASEQASQPASEEVDSIPESDPEIPVPPVRAKSRDAGRLADLLPAAFRSQPVRPGEQSLWGSPLVTSLTLGAVVLVLLSCALWFVIGRDASQRAYQLAIQEYDQHRFSQAITQLEEFLQNYPSHRQAGAARLTLGLAQIEQPIAGAAPAWDQGLARLEKFLSEQRRAADFPSILPQVRDLAERIAKGAAGSAGALKTPPLLKVATSAQQLFQLYSPPDQSPVTKLQEIDEAIQTAQLSIRKHDTFQVALGEMDSALKKHQPYAAFEARRKLLLKYPDLSLDKSLQSRLRSALVEERNLVTREALDRPAQTAERADRLAAVTLTLARQTRTRIDQAPGDSNVFTIAQDACYAVDSLSGVCRWRRVIGADTPFPPHPVTLEILGLVLFDTRHNELLLLRQRDGQLIWRQPLEARAVAAPLIHAGQIFIPTADSKLYQLDAMSGRITAVLKLSQPLATAPLLIQQDERLVIAGDRAVLYTLNYRPLECVAVTYTGHAAGGLKAPLLRLGDFLLSIENDRKDSALLRLWDASRGEESFPLLATERVTGNVVEPPVLRGKQMVVPSSRERLTAFTVSDEKGEKALAKVGSYQAEHPRQGPVYVTLGADDDVWMTSSTLRRLQLAARSLVPQKGELTLGVTTQPVQSIDQTLIATSRLPYSSATYFLAADRQQMSTQWIAVLGSRPIMIGTAVSNTGSQAILTESGDIFALTAAKVKTGGFESRPVTTLQLPPGSTTPLEATVLQSGQIAAWSGQPEPRLWILNQDGVIQKEIRLPATLEAAPIQLNGGLLLPLPSQLKLVESPQFGSTTVEDLVVGADPAQPQRWQAVLPITDGTQAIAVSDQGRVTRCQVRTEPVPHVAEVAVLELKSPLSQRPLLMNDRLVIALQNTLRQYDVGTLENRAELELPGPVTQGPWLCGDQLIVVCGRQHVVAVHVEKLQAEKLTIVWQQVLGHEALAGPPTLHGDELILTLPSGELRRHKASTGELAGTIQTGSSLASGLHILQDQKFVMALDGTLVNLTSQLERQP